MNVSRRSLLAGAAAAVAFPLTRSAATGQLRELELGYAGRIGAWALDTATGRHVSYRSGELFPLLSTFKLLAAGAILVKARRGDPGLLDRLIRYGTADLLPSSPITTAHVDTGLTVAELCAAAIEYSDNTAGNLLLAQLGGPPAITRFARSIGDPVTRLDRWETDLNIWNPTEVRDTTTPAAMGRDLCRLALGPVLVPQDRARLIGWLRGTVTGTARIRAGLPATWTVGDKTGSSSTYGAANDLAIAWPPSAPPILLILYTNRDAVDAPTDNTVIARAATILAGALGKL